MASRGKIRQVKPASGRWAGWRRSAALLFVLLAAARGLFAAAPELREAALHGFHEYVAKVDQRNQASLRSPEFLWIEELPAAAKESAYEKLKRGEVLMRRWPFSDGKKPADIPGGMIHHWQGIVFIPGAKLDQVLGVLQDYDHHASYYAPDVESARIESRDGDHFRVFMRFRRHKVVTVVLNTEQDINYYRDSLAEAHSRSTAIRIREVANAGSPSEREKSSGEDNGFLWQMETWWRMEERDGGVYVQNEAVTLTRNIPTGLGWLIEPLVTSIPKETLEFTLGATRKAVLAKANH